MMKIYVATIEYHYEGQMILGLYSTLEKALARLQKEAEQDTDDFFGWKKTILKEYLGTHSNLVVYTKTLDEDFEDT